MRCGARLVVFAVAIVSACPHHAGALSAVPEDTIEWAVSDADAVVRGTIEQVVTVEAGQAALARVTLRVAETIKAPPGQPVAPGGRLTFTAIGWREPEAGAEHVFFLIAAGRFLKASGQLSPEVTAAITADPYVLRNHRGDGPWALDASDDPNGPRAIDGARVRRADLLNVLRAEAARPAVGGASFIEIQISPTSQAYPPAAGDYPPLLNVLIDDRAEARAREWVASPDPMDRWNGASVLAARRSPANAGSCAGSWRTRS